MTDLNLNKDNLSKESLNNKEEYCNPSFFRDTYKCPITLKNFQWIGMLPEYCPRCGKPIKDRQW